MNLKNLFRVGFLLLFITLFTGVMNAQVGTYYVNNASGNDANSGTSAGNAKATVSSALQAAPTGSTISVAFTGINYTEPTPGMNLVPGPLTPGVTGTYTFTSTGGTPVFTSLFQLGVAATPGTLTFTGPFQFYGLTLTNGTLAGANNITITSGATVYRSDIASISTGQLAFAGTANFVYDNTNAGARGITTGLEFPVVTTAANNLSTTTTGGGVLTLTLDQNRTINGTLTTAAGNLTALGGFTLNIINTAALAYTHSVGGNVTGGTLNFTINATTNSDDISGSAASTLPAIIVNATGGGPVFTINNVANIGVIGNLTSNGTASITTTNVGNVGNVTLNGSGTITTSNTTGTVGAVLASATSTGTIILNRTGAGAQVATSITQSGLGAINYGAAVSTTITVNTFVTLNTAFSLSSVASVGLGTITFKNLPVTISGALTNSASFLGSTNKVNTTSGNIIFLGTTNTVSVTGLTWNNTSGGWTGVGSLTTSGRITFATTIGGNLTFTGGVTNNSSLSGTAPLGDIIVVGVGGATTLNAGAVSNTSSVATANIDFQNLTGTNTLASVSSSGGVGGQTIFGDGNAVVAGNITNSRTSAGADIIFGKTALGSGNSVSANNITNSGLSNITFNTVTVTGTGDVTVSNTLSLTSSGNITFSNATTAVFGITNLTVNGTGTLDFGDQTVVAAQGNINITGNAQFLNGTVDMGQNAGGARTVTLSGAAIQLGGASTRVIFTNATTTTIVFAQPIPNVNQIVTLGTFNQQYSGPVTVTNAAVLPAPFVIFQSVAGASGTPGALTIVGNNLTFNTGAVGNVNTVQLNNARFYIGTNNPGGSAGNFQNTTGYSTINGGFVMMQGNALQTVNAGAITAGATFGNFGVSNNSGATPAVIFNTAGSVMTADFYLALGQVRILNLVFGTAAAPAPYPTIFRTEGTFDAQLAAAQLPNFVNVTYYGGDKATANEIPNAGLANFLFNLTVATTNGASPGQGIVTMAAAATVNGTLTVNVGQSLYTGAFALTMAGSSAVINGYLVDDGTTRVQLAAPGGTTFTGTGSLPSLQVNAGSTNNIIDGAGLVSNGLGAGGVWGGGNDDFTTMDGSITFAGGAASSLTATFSAPVVPSTTNFLNLTTAAGATFTLGANAIMGGDINHVAGTVALGNFNLTNNGIAPGMTGGALFTGTGTLFFPTGATVFTIAGSAGTIGVNTVFSGATATFAGFNLEVDGNLTLGTVTPTATVFTIPVGLTLTAGGLNVTTYGTSSFAATTGILNLVNTAPNVLLTWNIPTAATPTVANLNIGGNVTLSGAALTSLTVNVNGGGGTGFVMNAGAGNTFSFGATNLIIGGGAVATPFRYISGLFSGTGYLDWNSNVGAAGWRQDAAFAINNLQVDQALDITRGNATLIGSTLTVNNNLYLNGAVLTQTRTVATTGSLLNIAALAQIRVDGTGNINNAAGQLVPVFAGLVNYLFGGASSAPNTLTWPTAQANNVTITMGAAINTVTTGASKSIAGNLTETVGQLIVSASTTFTMATVGANVTVDRNALSPAIFLNGAGPTLAVFTGPNVNLFYTDLLAVGTAYNSGPEYSGPTIINNITIGVAPGPTVTNVNLNFARTINGLLAMYSTLNINANTTWLLAQTIPAGSTVNVAAGVTVTWDLGLTANGTYADAATSITLIPAGGLTVGGSGTVTLSGTLGSVGNPVGPISVATGGTFTNNGTVFSSGWSGPATFGASSVMNLTGDATFGNIGGLPGSAATAATINTPNNITFTGTYPSAPDYLNLNFTGTNNQTVTQNANMNFQNVTLNKGNDGTVTFSGGNATLNPVNAGPNVAGLLTLTRGILVVGNISNGPPAVPALFTIQLTVSGGIITNLGYLRNPANTTNLAHVMGRLGVMIPAGTIGRTEWPVGSLTYYRPAAITFTAGNATIATTTIVVSHVDMTPTGIKNFPINGGTQANNPSQTLYIGSPAPYYWVMEATVSLGASQLFDVELNGSNINKPLTTYNDLRIIRRFDGDVTVNGWYMEGAGSSYSNAMYINTPNPGDTLLIVRNRNSLGSAISQRAIFTIGIPSTAPVFTAPVTLNYSQNEATTLTVNFSVNAPDAGTTITNLVFGPGAPSWAALSATTGTQTVNGSITFTPTYGQGGVRYPVTLTATSSNGLTSSITITDSVIGVNRPPVFTQTAHDTTVKNDSTLTVALHATDPDAAETLTFSLAGAITPAFAGTASVSGTGPSSGANGTFTITPAFADTNKTFAVTIRVSDGTLVKDSTINVHVIFARKLGNVDGLVNGPSANSASLVLQYVVGLITLTPQQLYAADVNKDGQVGALDAAWILYATVSPNGSFPDGSFPKVVALGTAKLGQLSTSKENADIVNIPVVLENSQGVMSSYFELNISNNYADIENVTTSLPKGWIAAHNYANGVLKIAMSGVTPLTNGSIAMISLKLKDKNAKFDINGLAKLNDKISTTLSNYAVRAIPDQFELSQNYPNPFNPTTTIKYQISQDTRVTLTVYDMLGQVVKTLVNGTQQQAGYYDATWDGLNNFGQQVSSGIYIYRLEAGPFVKTLKMNLLK